MPSSCETLGVEPGCVLTDRLERERDEAQAKLDWLTMRGTDELPRNDLEGNRIRDELTGQALVEYLRAQRRSERERAEKAERERDEALKHIAQLEDLYGSAALRLQELGEKEVSLTPLAALFADARAEVERLKAQRDALVVELRESYEYLDGWCQGDSCPGDEHEESFKNGEVHCPVCVLRRSWRKLLSEIEAPQ